MTDKDFDELLAELADEPTSFARMEQVEIESLTAEQRRRLAMFLRAQSRLRETLAGADSFVACVMAAERAPTGARAFVDSVMQRQAPKVVHGVFSGRFGWLPWGIAAAACLAAVLSWWRPLSRPATSPPPVVAHAKDDTGVVGVMVQEVRSVFADRNPLEHGFAPGRYTMTHGLAHVRLLNGADLVLKAPMIFSLESAMRIHLENGGLRARVPPQAHGFTVATQGVEYRDLGTEFTVSVGGKTGTSSVHVYDGAVELYDGAGKRLDMVLVGGSVSFQSGNIHHGEAAQPPEIPGTEAVKQQKWMEMSKRLRGDPTLLAYYSFERNATLDAKLPDMKTTGNPAHGEIHGARWVSGRWPGKRALFFDRDDDFVEVTLPGEHTHFTVAAWVLIDRLDYNNNAIFASNGWEPGAVHMNVSRYARLFGGAYGTAQDAMATQMLRTGVWSLVLMTVDAPGRKVTGWLNGQRIYEKVYQTAPPIRPGVCRIGSCLPPSHEGNPVRTIRGRIDELAVWNRVLSAEEIEDFYHDGSPDLLEQVAAHKPAAPEVE